MSHLRSPFHVVALLAATAVLAACGSTASVARPHTIGVAAGFYPLAYAAAQIGAGHVTVHDLGRPGVDAHDIDLTPQDMVTVSQARVVFYEKAFQPAVDAAVAAQASTRGFDVAPSADLTLVDAGGEGVNGHFWPDPVRFAGVAEAMGAELARVDPANASAYAANTARFVDRLHAIDRAFTTGLASCASRDLVTGHGAWSYFAMRFHLTARAIAGLSPEAEPDAQTLGTLTAYVRDHHIRTVFAEPLTSPALTDTLAQETGARVATLDPAEGLSAASLGTTYEEIMRNDLDALRAGLSCR